MARILQFIRTDASAFDGHATYVMGEAFDDYLQDSNLSDLVREVIAERIIEAAKRGERDPQRLCSIALAAMNGERMASQGTRVANASELPLQCRQVGHYSCHSSARFPWNDFYPARLAKHVP